MGKTTKKDERLARALCLASVQRANPRWPYEELARRADCYWPEMLEEASTLNIILDTIKLMERDDYPLDGEIGPALTRRRLEFGALPDVDEDPTP